MRACLIAAVLSIAPFSQVLADTVAYGVAYDELYRIDLGTRVATSVGRTGTYAGLPLSNLTGLSYGPGNELYAIAGNQKSLIRIDSNNASTTYIGNFGLTGQGQGQLDSLDLSMTYGCDGSFWMTSAVSRDLWRVSAQSAAITRIGSTSRQISGLAMRNGVLYGTGIGADQGLYTINMQNGAATRISTLADTVPWIDPGFGSDGKLWASLSYNPPFDREWSDLARFDLATGAMTNLGPITGPASLSHISMKGFAVAPNSCVPEVPDGSPVAPAALPIQSNWAMILLGLLVLAASGWHLRRRFNQPL
ncbi:MAG TPA: LPXTG cell wall anchor domain-containing protein [Dokdonella sp.]|uniref:DUF6923 family protein n=1 Tax=Dokdonella sp. TaxID=2291710 RepID=UPI002D7F5497|nr:LPXTG cell wall anchor domain-containing protein [Dokdonella sp.]HET9033025.1 LPXTG cell wall anchor domain-containing protein [Dokdonella sp.]